MKLKEPRVSKKISADKQKKRNKIWPIVVETFKEFAEESTIHGIKYTVQAKTAKERLFWLTIILISIIFAGALSKKFYERHQLGNMRSTIVSDNYPSFKIPLPSLTLCHGSVVSLERTKIFLNKHNLNIPPGLSISDFRNGLKYLRELVYPYNNFPVELGKLQLILNANNISVFDLLKKVSAKCMDSMVMCVYEGETVPCNKIFFPNLTSYGICCSFNNALDGRYASRNLTYRRLYSFSFGARYIVSVLLKPYNESDRVATTTYSGGYKVLVDDCYAIVGTTSISFMLKSGYETIVNLKVKEITVSPEVLELAIPARKCRHSTKDNVYRLHNCYMHCRQRILLKHCKCLHYFASGHHGIPRCNFSHIPCLVDVIPVTYSLKLHSLCNCLPQCEGTDYGISLTGQPFTAAQFRPGKFYRKAENFSGATAMHFTFAHQSSLLESKELVLSWINLVSSLGGVFSLYLGCSFISVFEFFYCFVFRLIWKIYVMFKRNSVTVNLK